MTLSDYKGEAALDLLAALIEPAGRILGDSAVAAAMREHGTMLHGVKLALTRHKGDVIAILAAVEGVDPAAYAEQMTLVTLPKALLALLEDPMLQDLFPLQGQSSPAACSGSVTETIGAKET